MFRVFDKVKNCWVKDEIYLSSNNDLFISKNILFGLKKLSLVSEYRYTYHRSTDLYDKNKVMIFEGDICKIEHLNVVGLIAYIPELVTYCLLDDESLKYYPLDEYRCRQIEIMGNIFENKNLIETEHE